MDLQNNAFCSFEDPAMAACQRCETRCESKIVLTPTWSSTCSSNSAVSKTFATAVRDSASGSGIQNQYAAIIIDDENLAGGHAGSLEMGLVQLKRSLAEVIEAKEKGADM